jgi:hypothetical protein
LGLGALIASSPRLSMPLVCRPRGARVVYIATARGQNLPQHRRYDGLSQGPHLVWVQHGAAWVQHFTSLRAAVPKP